MTEPSGLLADHYRALARYNAWMNGKVYAVCADLDEAERKRDRGAFFKSIHSTLDHILLADRYWMGRFTGVRYEVKRIGEDLFDAFDDLRAARDAMDGEILDWAAGLTDAWLVEPLTWTSGIDKQTRTLPRWACVSQLFNHQTHHRGQVHDMLSQAGLSPPELDLIYFIRAPQASRMK